MIQRKTHPKRNHTQTHAKGARRVTPFQTYACTAHRCRRAKQCLGRARMCPADHDHIDTRTDAEKHHDTLTAVRMMLAKRERESALAVARGEPKEYDPVDDPNLDLDEKVRLMNEELRRACERLGLD